MKKKLKICACACLMVGALTSCKNPTSSEIDYSIYNSAIGSKGTELYCWGIANDSWRCGVLPGTNSNKTFEELKKIQEMYPCPLDTMKVILSTYFDEARNNILILIIDYPLTMDNYAGRAPGIDTLNYLKNELGLH